MSKLGGEWRNFLRDDQAWFRLMTSLKVTSITSLSFFFLVAATWLILALDLIFFRTKGYPGYYQFTEVFFESVVKTSLVSLPHIFVILIFVIFLGLYVGHLLMRPFRIIAEYCEKKIESNDATYDPDFFSDLKLLTNFSEYFFIKMEEERKKSSKFEGVEIPTKFTRIHRPVFEKGFFIQFALIIMMISIGAGIYLYAMMMGAYADLMELSSKVMPQSYEVNYFLTEQAAVWDIVVLSILSLHILLYFFLAFHLYSRVSVPAFGFFATMRSFMKGNTSVRVHLIGFNYIRPHSRMFNRYLDQLEIDLKSQKDS
jgi:cell division protein FtsL